MSIKWKPCWRTALDYAHLLKAIVDEYYDDAACITLVQDQLNTHTPVLLYKAFKPAEARRILHRLEFCYTPKHGRRSASLRPERFG